MFNFLFGDSNEKESTLYENENYYIDEDKYIDTVYKNDKLIYQKKVNFKKLKFMLINFWKYACN